MRVCRNQAAILDPNLQRGIGKQLRAMYDEMMDHVPSRHLDLLQRFEQDEASLQVATQHVPKPAKYY
jgi:hypothetical protein